MTVSGLAAGITPVHAAPKAEVEIGVGYLGLNFNGDVAVMHSGADCESLMPDRRRTVRSALNTSSSSTIKLYKTSLPFFGCVDEVAALDPGEIDTGFVGNTGRYTELGLSGARYYSST